MSHMASASKTQHVVPLSIFEPEYIWRVGVGSRERIYLLVLCSAAVLVFGILGLLVVFHLGGWIHPFFSLLFARRFCIFLV